MRTSGDWLWSRTLGAALLCGMAVGCQTVHKAEDKTGAVVGRVGDDVREASARSRGAEERGEVVAGNTNPGEAQRTTGQPFYGDPIDAPNVANAAGPSHVAGALSYAHNPHTAMPGEVPGLLGVNEVVELETVTTEVIPAPTVSQPIDAGAVADRGNEEAAAPVGEATSCGKLITGKSSAAVGDPCITTNDFIATLNLTAAQKTRAERLVDQARSDTSGLAH